MDQTKESATPDPAPTSIFDRIGGADAVAAVVDLFYVRVLADDELAPYFTGTDVDRLKAHQRAFVGSALGSPGAYAGRGMNRAHQGLDITGAHFDRVVDHLAASLTEAGVDDGTIGEIAARLAPLKPEIVSG
ncbi:group 1 truncated hemoglobin [Streptomyces sp. NPDC059783]|uniref:group I truncated hemoglobin n=1 Tax=Streptomyces sp. NPDC059783 TaxID=3346944 RepID=UPI00365DFF5F